MTCKGQYGELDIKSVRDENPHSTILLGSLSFVLCSANFWSPRMGEERGEHTGTRSYKLAR